MKKKNFYFYLLILIFLILFIKKDIFSINEDLINNFDFNRINMNNNNKKPFENSFYKNINIKTINGLNVSIKIHYRIWTNIDLNKSIENKNIYKFLLIHGFAGSTYSYQKFSDLILKNGKSFFILAFDLPNFGYSERKKLKLSNIDFSIIIFKLIKEIDEDYKISNSNWFIFGHSMGGRIALFTIFLYEFFIKNNKENLIDNKFKNLYNILKSNNVINYEKNNEEKLKLSEKVFLISPALNEISKNSILFKLDLLKNFLINTIKINLNYISIEQILKVVYNKDPEIGDIYGYLNPLLIPYTIHFVLYMLDTNDPFKISSFINFINMEIIFIWGDKDIIVPFNENTQKLINKIKSKKIFFIPNSGHCPMETDVEKFLDIVLSNI